MKLSTDNKISHKLGEILPGLQIEIFKNMLPHASIFHFEFDNCDTGDNGFDCHDHSRNRLRVSGYPESETSPLSLLRTCKTFEMELYYNGFDTIEIELQTRGPISWIVEYSYALMQPARNMFFANVDKLVDLFLFGGSVDLGTLTHIALCMALPDPDSEEKMGTVQSLIQAQCPHLKRLRASGIFQLASTLKMDVHQGRISILDFLTSTTVCSNWTSGIVPMNDYLKKKQN